MRFFLQAVVVLCLSLCVSCGRRPALTSDELLKRAKDAAAAGKWDDAVSLTGQVLKRNGGDSRALIMRSVAFYHRGDRGPALEEAAKAAKAAPDNFMAQYNYGWMLFEDGKFGDCVGPLSIALKIRPDDVDTAQLLARVYDSLGGAVAVKARKYYLIMLKSERFKNDPMVYNDLACNYLAGGDADKALKLFSRAKKLAPENPVVILNLAVLCDKHLDRRKIAAGYYRKYLNLVKDNPALNARRLEVERRLMALNH